MANIDKNKHYWPAGSVDNNSKTNRVATCSSLFFLHGSADARLIATKKEDIGGRYRQTMLIQIINFVNGDKLLKYCLRIDAKKFELWKIKRGTNIVLFLDLEI